MGSLFGKPSQADYDAGPATAASAATTKFSYERDKTLFGPVRKEQMEEAAKYDVGAVTSRVASADAMQALTDRPNLRAVKNVATMANTLSGSLGQSEQARTTALDTKRKMQLGSLESARNKKAVTDQGLTAAAAHETSQALSKATRANKENLALGKMLVNLGTSTAYGMKYGEDFDLKNIGKGGSDKLDLFQNYLSGVKLS